MFPAGLSAAILSCILPSQKTTRVVCLVAGTRQWCQIGQKTVAIIVAFPVQVAKGERSGLELRDKREYDKKGGRGRGWEKEEDDERWVKE